MGALTGIRVLDAGLLVQGPQAAQTLADMGADVIKIELPVIGDQSRWIPSSPDDNRSGFFQACNRGKRSVALDLRTADGSEAFLRLVDTADVVIANFSVGTMEEWGVGYETAAARNPGIIYGLGSTLGTEGPHATREGVDLVAQAMGGLISTTGRTDEAPTPVGVTIADHIGSQNLTVGVLAALVARTATGRGQRIDVSLLGGQIYAQASEYTSYFLSGSVPGRADQGHPLIRAIYGVFATSDGHIGVLPSGSRRAAFFEIMGMPELDVDERLATLWMTATDRRAILDRLAPVFLERTTAEWRDVLTAADVRCAPVNDYASASEDPHASANGYIAEVEHPEWGPMRSIGSPIRMSETPPESGITAPTLGAHTTEILAEIGYSADDIDAMRASGAVA